MDTINQPTAASPDLFDGEPKKLPGMLNTLTILTFIGCALAYFFTIKGFFDSMHIDKARAELEKAQESMGDSEMANNMMAASMEMLDKSYENRYILLVSGLLFTTLCLVGALQMRKLKKSGFPIYVIGEVAPVVLTAVLMGFSIVGGFMTIVGAVIALVFVLLYASQRKHLIH
ncbi:MAG TPA: hypothetical protein VM843_08990 [Flavisolibacter sp.]|jgi:hypothetical protein|nr:hypothetical protein [Flavisolibacter sp.]